MILQLTDCPEETRRRPAEITDRFVLGSTDGPIEYVNVHCVVRHHFTVPVGRLAGDGVRSRPGAAAGADRAPSDR